MLDTKQNGGTFLKRELNRERSCATQHHNIVATLFLMVVTFFQHCNAVLRLSLRIVTFMIDLDANEEFNAKFLFFRNKLTGLLFPKKGV